VYENWSLLIAHNIFGNDVKCMVSLDIKMCDYNRETVLHLAARAQLIWEKPESAVSIFHKQLYCYFFVTKRKKNRKSSSIFWIQK
jgi:hypothetical protein